MSYVSENHFNNYFFYLNDLYGKSLSIVEMALPIAYGSRTILSAFYHLSTEYNLFIC